jgi:1-deoxy-D-xylulose-5-phosphate synthase
MDECELRRLMYTAQLPDKGPFMIRYPRGRGSVPDWHCPFEEIPVGKGRKIKDGKDLAIISYGPIGIYAARAIEQIEINNKYSIAHYDLRFVKPLDSEMLDEIGKSFDKIITIEDGVKEGGMGSIVLEYLNDNGFHPELIRIGVPDKFVEHGTVDELYHRCGMDAEGICREILNILK